MMNKPSKKTGIIIAVSIFIIIDILFALYYFYNKSEEGEFKYYNYLDISNNVNNIAPENYVDDNYLISLVMLDKYNGIINNYNFNDILYYYMNIATKSSSLKLTDSDTGTEFCLKKSTFKKSIKELFNYDISLDMFDSSLPNYVSQNGNKVCFEYSYSDLNDYAYFIGIDNLSVNNDIINAKLYLYKVGSEDREDEEMFRKSLIASINNNTLEDFNYFSNQSESIYINIEEKDISFKEIPNGKYFKYQLISINTK